MDMISSAFKQLINNEDLPENLITIKKLSKQQPVTLTQLLSNLAEVEPDEKYGLLLIPHYYSALEVSPDQLERATKILHALIDAFSKRGLSYEFSDAKYMPSLKVAGQFFSFRIRELTTKKTVQKNESYTVFEQLRLRWSPEGSTALFPTGKLYLEIINGYTLRKAFPCGYRWDDDKKGRLESKLNTIMKDLYLLGEGCRIFNEKYANERKFKQPSEENEKLLIESNRVRSQRADLIDKLTENLEKYKRAQALACHIQQVITESNPKYNLEKLMRLQRWVDAYLRSPDPLEHSLSLIKIEEN